MSRPSVLVILFAVLLIAGVSFLLFSPFLTGDDYLKQFFLEQLEQNLGRKIDVHRIKFVLFPNIRLELTQVGIHDRQSDQVVLAAKKVDLVLRLLPLLRKQVVGKRLVIEEPTLTLRRDRNGHWNVLDQVVQGAATDQDALQMMSRMFRIREATLVNGTVTIVDEARPDGPRSMKLESVEAALKIWAERGQADVHVSAVRAGEAGVSAVSLAGRIARVEQPSLTANAPSQLVLQFDGSMEAANLNLRDVADFFGPRPIPEQLKGTINLSSTVRAQPGVAGYDVLLSDLSAKAGQFALSGKASLSGLMSAQPTVALTFASAPIRLNELLTVIPAQWIHPQLAAVIQDRQINGQIEAVSATVTASSVSGPQLSVTGEFHVRDAEALVGEDRVPAKDVSAVVSVEAGRVRVSNLTGVYGAILMSDGKALVSFLEAGPWLELEITGTMPAADLLQFLSKTVKSERLSRVLASSREVEGQAAPTFRMVGPLNQPGGVTFAGGEITAQQISLTNPSLPERLTALQGRFVLLDGETRFDQVKGHLGDLVVEVQGGMTGGSASSFQDFLVRVRGDAIHMTRLLPPKSLPEGAIDGIINGDVVLTGLTDAPRLRGEVMLTEAKVFLPGMIEKPVGAPASVQFDGELSTTSVLTLTRVELQLPSLRLPIKGRLQLGERFSIDAALATGTLSLSSLPEWIAKGGFEAGNIELSLDMKGKDRDWRTWRTTGWLALTNGLMTASGVDGPIQDLYLRLHLVRSGAELKRLSFRVADSDVSLEGTIRNWTVKPIVAARIESNNMDIDLLIPKGARSPIRDFLETLAATSKVNATATIARGHYKHLKFGSLSARITIQDGVLDIDRLSGQSPDGELAGRFVVQLPRNQPADGEVSLRATGLVVEDLLKLVGSKGPVTGEARVSGTIRGHGRNPHGIYPTLNGKVDVLVQDGRIFKSQDRAIWKIISILNLPAVLQGKVDLEKEGLPYSKITATVTVRDGLFETENLIIDSPIIKVTAAGNYDLPTDQLDMVWAVSPFGSYSQFLKTIPLFGRLFAGDRKGFATAMFSVKGAIEDPETTYLPMKSFAVGLTGLGQLAFDLLKNTVTLPLDLMTPNEDKTTDKEGQLTLEPAPSAP